MSHLSPVCGLWGVSPFTLDVLREAFDSLHIPWGIGDKTEDLAGKTWSVASEVNTNRDCLSADLGIAKPG